jgi:neutral/alkaline ceramidase-like enzyme
MRFLIAFLALAPLGQAAFRASAVKVDITPQEPKWLLGYGARQSTGVHDRIYHRIVAMDDGQAPFFLISTDICIYSPTVYEDLTGRLQKDGISPLQVWWTVTHTHSAPEVGPPGIYKVLLKGRSEHPVDAEYTELVVAKLVEGVKEARQKLAPARIGIGTGYAAANINRRARDADGRISLGLNPDGPVDRQIGLIRLESAVGAPIALIANYSMHGTVLGGKFVEISGDAQGIVSSYVEEKFGAPVLSINGAAGNLAPIYSVYPDPKSGHLGEFRVLLGDRILAANRNLGDITSDVSLWTAEKIVETPRKSGLGWPDDLPSYQRVDAAGAPLVRLPVRFLKINRTVIWAAPVELFCEISMQIRNRSPFANTFYFGYSNGWLGYLPTKAAFSEGGYEPNTSPFSPRAEADLIEGVLTFLEGMPR